MLQKCYSRDASKFDICVLILTVIVNNSKNKKIQQNEQSPLTSNRWKWNKDNDKWRRKSRSFLVFIIICFVCVSKLLFFRFMCMFCRSLFVLLYVFFWPLCFLFFFDIRILITPLVSSSSSSGSVIDWLFNFPYLEFWIYSWRDNFDKRLFGMCLFAKI